MTDILVAVGLLIFEIVLFFWCRFIKRHFLSLNGLLRSLCWINWLYWLLFCADIWHEQRFIFPYSFIVHGAKVGSFCMVIAFVFSFLIVFQAPFLAKPRRGM
ncbi:hypothetical protein EV690_0092 [Celerinatantimonas diazotrophica]|uniref:Uncharacterized protein n=1 Tax=Celerinatantimonas diazotrophica TaxID=412034 RepID=A0A4R1KGS9_9GAMM|nr:hypothetical protein EV690_0092 [Celerinatantimonas diazotrophica]CAG9297063.1 hypothetical protein CEDIAZO_02225 [Celerinatantimonas diazotrophica]